MTKNRKLKNLQEMNVMLRPKFHHKAHTYCTNIILCQKKKT